VNILNRFLLAVLIAVAGSSGTAFAGALDNIEARLDRIEARLDRLESFVEKLPARIARIEYNRGMVVAPPVGGPVPVVRVYDCQLTDFYMARYMGRGNSQVEASQNAYESCIKTNQTIYLPDSNRCSAHKPVCTVVQ
jgi:hypothetical protein